MALGLGAREDLLVLADQPAEDHERRPRIVLGEDIEHLRRVRRVRAIIEGKGYTRGVLPACSMTVDHARLGDRELQTERLAGARVHRQPPGVVDSWDAEVGEAGPGGIRGEQLGALYRGHLIGGRCLPGLLRGAARQQAGRALLRRQAQRQEHQRGDEAGERS